MIVISTLNSSNTEERFLKAEREVMITKVWKMHSGNIDYLMKKISTKTWVEKPWRVHTLGETNYRTEEAMRQATELNLF